MNDDDMCEETNEHPSSDCHRYGCQAYIDELYAGAPWGTSRQGLKGWAE